MYNFFIAEGHKICAELLNNARFDVEFFVGREAWITQNSKALAGMKIPVHQCNATQMEQMSNLTNPPDVLAVVKMPQQRKSIGQMLEDSCFILDEVQDPGNVGTIIRIADWFGIRSVLRTSSSADFYNPKVIQATMGSFLGVNLSAILDEDLEILEHYRARICVADLEGKPLDTIKLVKNPIVILGNEGKGVSPAYLALSDNPIFIAGSKNRIAESLNVANSAAIFAHKILESNG